MMTDQRSSYLKLTAKQRTFVDCRLDGMSQVAAAAAAGVSKAHKMEHNENVQAAMIERMSALAEEVDFSRREAHDMYMQAYTNADTATEQIAAVTAMVKLHGLEKPKILQIEHEHVHSGSLELLPTEELLRLAGMEDIVLEGEYEDITDAPKLEAPEATDDNTDPDPPTVPPVSEDY